MVLKFYYDIASPPVRAVYFTIKTLNVPVEMVELRMARGDIKSEEYLKINPQGTVPCIDDDGFILIDSHAINVYLTSKYAGGEKLYPSDPKKRAIINERLYFESCELFALLKSTVRNTIMNGFSVIDDDDILSRFDHVYYGLETYLKKSHYIAGDDLTLADFSVVTTVSSMNVFVPIKKEKFPLLCAYLNRATRWPYYEQINEPGIKKVSKFRDMLKLKL